MNRFLAFAALAAAACASQNRYIPGSRGKIPDTSENWKIIHACEDYRLAVERKDVAALLGMASKNYWEDGGTPKGDDDYGYDGLRDVLDQRFSRADNIRYSLRYMTIKREHEKVAVEVLIDASFTIKTGRGDQRSDMRDQNQLVLENDNGKWMFVSGM
jgi:hypothetical protein